MSKRKWLLASAAGAVTGFLANAFMNRKQDMLTPEAALQLAQDTFEQTGPINGSWIYMEADELDKNNLTYTVYRGGVNRTVHDDFVPYDFAIDARTGAIIDSEPSV